MAEEAAQPRLDDAGSASGFNQHAFAIDQALTRIRTSVVVKIIAVHGGGVGPAPTVDVQPLVKQVDGQGGSATSHGTIYGIPCTRMQAGDSVIINDPVVGDIGTMVVHDRDISSLKANKGEESNPGSYRRFDPADGVYHGPMLNQTQPKQYIQFTSDGLTIADRNGNKMVMSKDGIAFTTPDGKNVTTNNDIIAGQGGGNKVSLQQHIHMNAGGTGNSGKPVPGA